MESLSLHGVRGRDKESEREKTQELYSTKKYSISIHHSLYICVFNEHFYTSPRRTDRSTDSTSMLIKSSYTNSQIYSSRNIFPNGLPVYAPIWPYLRTGLHTNLRIRPNRSVPTSTSSADPADVELVSQQKIRIDSLDN